jgi:glycosyltransferase involved in cell wall biosynthesis
VTAVHVVVPLGLDDPGRPSGGNRYDRRVCDGLTASGWEVRELAVPVPSPPSDPAALSALARATATVPDGGVVLVDGLIASAAADVLVPESRRLRLVVLVHMPLGGTSVAEGAECAVLTSARAVVTTSAWARRRLLDRYRLRPEAVRVARPGTDPSPVAPGSRDGGRLLCVGAVVPLKGHDVLIDALAGISDRPWSCALAGSLDREPGFASRLRRQISAAGLADRIRLPGPLPHDELRREYLRADALVGASRFETYGMVVTEALAAGVPVIATAVGGVPEALGRTDGGVPGLLVPPDDPTALREALAGWLRNPALRHRLRAAALRRRRTLTGWDEPTGRIAAVLSRAAGEPDPPRARVPR